METLPLRDGRRTVIDLINRDNGTQYRYGALLLGTPQTVQGQARNTAIVVRDKSHSAFDLGVTVLYNRLDIEEVFKMMWGQQALMQLSTLGYTRLSEMVDVINQGYGFDLIPEDFQDVEFDLSEPYIEHTLEMASSSHLYTGSLVLQLFNIDFSTVRVTSDGRVRLIDEGIKYIS